MIIRREKNKNYSIISNECFKDINISARAKGIYAYVMTLPDDWKISKKELNNHFTEGQKAIDTAFKELKDRGYIEQIRVQKDNGQFQGSEYIFHEFSINNNNSHKTSKTDIAFSADSAGNGVSENRRVGNQTLINTKEKQNTKRKLNTKLPKNIASEDSDQTNEPNQLVSFSSSFFLQESKPTNSTKEDAVKADLELIGLSRSQIIALLRVHDTSILENAVTETYQAQYEQKITEKASQYFYGILKNITAQKKESIDGYAK
jgi:hypothetical protein